MTSRTSSIILVCSLVLAPILLLVVFFTGFEQLAAYKASKCFDELDQRFLDTFPDEGKPLHESHMKRLKRIYGPSSYLGTHTKDSWGPKWRFTIVVQGHSIQGVEHPEEHPQLKPPVYRKCKKLGNWHVYLVKLRKD
ncbi:MAG: hypothetical protein QM627_06365 [Luteolibacter sp.]